MSCSAHADEERRAATSALDEVLRSARYRALLERLAAAVAAPPFRRSAGLPADQFLSEAISSRYQALQASIGALPPAPLDVELHAVRILAKPHEVRRGGGRRGAGLALRRFAKRVTELCDELGDLNDGSRMSLWLDAAGAEPSVASTVARVRAIEIGRMADARSAWVATNAKLRSAASELGWDLAGRPPAVMTHRQGGSTSLRSCAVHPDATSPSQVTSNEELIAENHRLRLQLAEARRESYSWRVARPGDRREPLGDRCADDVPGLRAVRADPARGGAAGAGS